MIHAITVSVNYADYLMHTLPTWRRRVAQVTVVTSKHDTQTQDVAAANGARVVLSDAFDGSFRKGRGINDGLRGLSHDGWLLHVDADIAILDPIKVAGLDKSTLYGAMRYTVCGQQDWLKVQQRPEAWREMVPCPQDEPFVVKKYRQRGRIRHRRVLPPGFFQLWHSAYYRDYPHQSPDASDDDILHAERFANTAILPIGVYHLESYDHAVKANWQGRRTGKF